MLALMSVAKFCDSVSVYFKGVDGVESNLNFLSLFILNLRQLNNKYADVRAFVLRGIESFQ